MREIEVLVRCDDTKQQLIDKMQKYQYISESKVIDVYYYDEMRETLKPDHELKINECFRLRDKDGVTSLTYKVDKFDEKGMWIYSDEYETIIANKVEMQKIIIRLGLKELIQIDNTKIIYESDQYAIFIEDVKVLGLFLEVELKVDRDEDAEALKEEIRGFINSLNLTNVRESNEGKPEMMLKNQQITIK